MKKRIKKIFKPGERVMLKLDRAPPKYVNKIAIVQDPPYVLRRSYHKLPYLNVRWEHLPPEAPTWIWPGSYFKREVVRRRSLMPDTRGYLDMIADWPSG